MTTILSALMSANRSTEEQEHPLPINAKSEATSANADKTKGKSVVTGDGAAAAAPRGLGKGKGVGAGGVKRHYKAMRNNIQGITKPAIRRLARRGGVKRLCDGIYGSMRAELREKLRRVLHDAIAYTEHAGRSTVTALDVVCALKHNNMPIYGVETPRR